MESVIKWRTGEPKEAGCYIVTLEDGVITCNQILTYIMPNGKIEMEWHLVESSDVIAWCPLSEIEPYKE